MALSDDKLAELKLQAWSKTIDVQEHFNDLSLRIRNLFVTLLAATLAVVGYALPSTGQAAGASLSALIRPYIPFVTILGVAICFAFWFLDRLWYHRLLRGAVEAGTSLEKALPQELGAIALTRTITDASHMYVGPFPLDATLRLDFFYGLFAVVLIFWGEFVESSSTTVVAITIAGVVLVGGIAIARAYGRERHGKKQEEQAAGRAV